MPQNKYALARYGLIDQILRKNPYVKTSYIVDVCKEKFGYDLSQRTVQLDLDAMRNDTFLGIYAPIEYSKKQKAYYYTHTDFELVTFRFSEREIRLLETACGLLESMLEVSDHQAMMGILDRVKKNSVAN